MKLKLYSLNKKEEDTPNPRFVLNGVVLSGGELIGIQYEGAQQMLCGYVYEGTGNKKNGHNWQINCSPFVKHPYFNVALKEGDQACFFHLEKKELVPDQFKRAENRHGEQLAALYGIE